MNLNVADLIQYYEVNGETAGILVVEGETRTSVPINPANRHYAEILKQVEAGTLVIQEADGGSE